MEGETCVICGGDGRISNAFGRTGTCPGCHGSGRRAIDSAFHDVTKTKPSHHRVAPKPGEAAKRKDWPATFEGEKLAREVRDSLHCEEPLKLKLIGEIIAHERTHERCTQTFLKKIRKQIRPPVE